MTSTPPEAASVPADVREALVAARDWIISNTSCESGSVDDDTMYERGWWDRDTKLMEQIDRALSSEPAPNGRAAAQSVGVRLESRPADDSQDWTEIFPAQLEWAAKEGHQVRAIEVPLAEAHKQRSADTERRYTEKEVSEAVKKVISEMMAKGEIRDTFDEPQAASVWQPIETAPKKVGRHLLMFGSGFNIHECEFIGRWHDYGDAGGGWVEVFSECRVEPTHWMQLGACPLARPEQSEPLPAGAVLPAYADSNFRYDEKTMSYHRIAEPQAAEDEVRYAKDVADWCQRSLDEARLRGHLETRPLVQNIELIIRALRAYALSRPKQSEPAPDGTVQILIFEDPPAPEPEPVMDAIEDSMQGALAEPAGATEPGDEGP